MASEFTEKILAISRGRNTGPPPQKTEPRRKAAKKVKKQTKQLLKQFMADHAPTSKAVSADTALSAAKGAIAAADADGNVDRARTLRKAVLEGKMRLMEHMRQHNGTAYSRMGPRSAELFKSSSINSLPDDDRDIKYF